MAKERQSRSRIIAFDMMRGYFLVAIIIDHLAFFPNGFDWWSARGALYVTAAEGFFFLSGLILGITRGQKLIKEPFSKVAKLLLARGFKLYLTSVVLILLFTFIGWLFYMNAPGLKFGIAPPGTNFFVLLWDTLSFQYFYGWVDYLRLYAIFLFASPLVFWLLRKGLWYVVLALSLGVWLLFPADPTVPPFEQEKLQFLSWQLLFFGGVMVGFYWDKLVAWWRGMAQQRRKAISLAVLILAGTTAVLNVLILMGSMGMLGGLPFIQFDEPFRSYLYDLLFDKERLTLTRIALFLLWFWAAYLLVRRFEKPLAKAFGWLLIPFGQNSLYVYTLHGFAIFFIHNYFGVGDLWFNFVMTVLTVAAIWLCVHYKVLMKVIPR